jgi:hypothetical protein
MLGADIAFCRVSRGVYALRAMPGVAPMAEPAKSAAPAATAGGGDTKGEADGKMSRTASVAAEQVGAAARWVSGSAARGRPAGGLQQLARPAGGAAPRA